ncbi:MAG: DUF3987 domain-containing protein [Acidobacteria bacterium]|nr:DUF3987 domain-containing protein [Acidobacteriota bacterium]
MAAASVATTHEPITGASFVQAFHALGGGEIRWDDGSCSQGRAQRFFTGKPDGWSLTINADKGVCHDKVAGLGGDIVWLAQRANGWTIREALEWADEYRPHSQRGTTPPPAKGKSQVVARYDYVDETGELLYQVQRWQPGFDEGRDKSFTQRRPDGSGGWVNKVDGVRRVPYHLPQLLAAQLGQLVFIPEGEKDVHTLERLGLVATCNSGGASEGKQFAEYSNTIAGRDAVILSDNDKAGRKHAAAVAAILQPVAASLRVVELPGLPDKGDVTDWVAMGGTREQLLQLVADTEAWDGEGLPIISEAESIAEESEWPTPEPLGDGLPEVAKFDRELLPDSLRPQVEDVAERMQLPLDFPAIAAIACLAGAVGRRAVIQPKRADSGWTEAANLFAAIVAPPGSMKSPCIDAVTKPLNILQGEWRREHEDAMRGHAFAVEQAELEMAAYRDQYKAACKSGKPKPTRPEITNNEPKCKRLIMHDATFEALHKTMAENPRGILVIRDELPGWWAQLDREGREGERTFYLTAWGGNSPFTMDRIGRGSINVDACCVSMLGGIQPGRLRSYLNDALADGPSNDGLIQRFQLMVWPDLGGDWKYIDRKPNAVAEERAARIYRALASMDPEKQVRFTFDDAAQQLFVEWLTRLELRLRNEQMHPALVAHLSKYRKLMPALALIFELADRAGGGFVGFGSSDSGQMQNIGLANAARAASFCDYLETHAVRVYSCVSNPHHRNASELLNKIKSKRIAVNGIFTAREVLRKGWTGLDTPERVRTACELLVDYGWIRELALESGTNGGRPSQRYEIHPEVTHEQG